MVWLPCGMAYWANGAIERWLAQEVEEEVLEPDLPIVDPVRRVHSKLHVPPPWPPALCRSVCVAVSLCVSVSLSLLQAGVGNGALLTASCARSITTSGICALPVLKIFSSRRSVALCGWLPICLACLLNVCSSARVSAPAHVCGCLCV